MLSLIYLCCLLPFVLSTPTGSSGRAASNGGLPKVDLGYEVHQAISFNVCLPSASPGPLLTTPANRSELQLFQYQIRPTSRRKSSLRCSRHSHRPQFSHSKWKHSKDLSASQPSLGVHSRSVHPVTHCWHGRPIQLHRGRATTSSVHCKWCSFLCFWSCSRHDRGLPIS